MPGGTALKVGEWYHVAGSSDGKVANTYVNGKLDRTRTCPAPHTATSRFDVNIGRAPDPVHGYFPGIVDEVRIWNRALSEKELQENMSSPTPSAYGRKARNSLLLFISLEN